MRRIFVPFILVLAIVMLASCATRTVSQPSLIERLDEAASYISSKTGGREIDVGLILGSGLGGLGDEIENPVIIRYEDIPYFPVSTVERHAGQLVIGTLEGKSVICMQGRVHYYEGYEMAQLVFPLQVMRRLGVETVIITNSAGCVNADWEEGNLMMITDHIKLDADNPLRGPNADELGERFFDMTTVYDKDLQAVAREAAASSGIDLKEGVYMYFAGPNFETPAEIRAARILGADAVGMSTVPEVIAAAHCGIKVLGISCMTNMAAGILDTPIDHLEVIEVTNRVKKEFRALVRTILRNM